VTDTSVACAEALLGAVAIVRGHWARPDTAGQEKRFWFVLGQSARGGTWIERGLTCLVVVHCHEKLEGWWATTGGCSTGVLFVVKISFSGGLLRGLIMHHHQFRGALA
jgi:hypothetical protein